MEVKVDWQKKKVLVTGGAGMIGSNLVQRLVESGADVFVVDNLWRGKLENLSDADRPLIDFDRKFFHLDLVDYDNCLKVSQNMDMIYHLADVVAGINYVFGNQLSVYQNNIVMNTNMLRAAIRNGVKNYIYVGTACSYPAEKQSVLHAPPFREGDAYPANPESSYGWSKLMGEYECELAEREGLINIGILRLHNAYGPKCEMSPEKSQVIPSLIRKAIQFPEEDFIVWGSGRQRRAFVYIDDILAALMAVAERGMRKGVIQIGPDYSVSIRDLAEIIVSISGKDITIRYDETKREGDMDRVADWSRAKKILGWSPKVNIEEGLQKTYEWCLQQADSGDRPAHRRVQ